MEHVPWHSKMSLRSSNPTVDFIMDFIILWILTARIAVSCGGSIHANDSLNLVWMVFDVLHGRSSTSSLPPSTYALSSSVSLHHRLHIMVIFSIIDVVFVTIIIIIIIFAHLDCWPERYHCHPLSCAGHSLRSSSSRTWTSAKSTLASFS